LNYDLKTIKHFNDSMDNIKVSRTLTLKGVWPKDFERTVSNSTSHNHHLPDKTVFYTETPKKFTSVEQWPQFSNLKCWECGLTLTSYPRFIPKDPTYDANGNDICDTEGVFNTWNCVVGYVYKNYPAEQWYDLLEAILIFESKFSGRRKVKIMPNPPKTIMKEYCGDSGVTSKQYLEKIDNINADYDLPVTM